MLRLAVLLSRARRAAVPKARASGAAPHGDAHAVAEEARVISEEFAARGRLNAELAHEINKPLGALEVLVCRLRDGSIGPERQADALASVARLADQLREIVRSVLDHADESVASSRVPLEDLIESARREVEAVHGSGRILVLPITRLSASPIVSQRLGRVLVNLLDNAIEAVGAARPVQLLISGDIQALQLEVRDEGSGIPSECLHRVADPFVSFRDGGFGLGLWISRQIVEEMGGRLTFESDPGRGTTARVQLPWREMESAA